MKLSVEAELPAGNQAQIPHTNRQERLSKKLDAAIQSIVEKFGAGLQKGWAKYEPITVSNLYEYLKEQVNRFLFRDSQDLLGRIAFNPDCIDSESAKTVLVVSAILPDNSRVICEGNLWIEIEFKCNKLFVASRKLPVLLNVDKTDCYEIVDVAGNKHSIDNARIVHISEGGYFRCTFEDNRDVDLIIRYASVKKTCRYLVRFTPSVYKEEEEIRYDSRRL